MTDATLPGLRDYTEAPTDIPSAPTPEAPAVEPQDTSDGLYSRLVGENHIIPSLMRAMRDRGEVDLDFVNSMTVEGVHKDLKMLGVEPSPAMRRELYESINEQDYFYKIQRIEERMALEEEVAKLGGWSAFGVQLASYASDPVAFAIDAATGFAAKGNFVKRAVTAGSGAALGEAAIQTILSSDGETTPHEDVVMGMGMAFLLGGGLGGVFGRRLDEGRNSIRNTTRLMRENDGPLDDSTGAMRDPTMPQQDPAMAGRTDTLQDLRTEGGEVEELGKVNLRLDATASFWRRALDNVAQKKLISRLFPSFIKADRGATNNLSAVEIAEHFVGRQERELRAEVTGQFNKWLESTHGQGAVKRGLVSTFQGGKRLNLEEEFNELVGDVQQQAILAEERAIAEYRDALYRARAAGEPDPVFQPRNYFDEIDAPDEVKAAAKAYFDRYKAMDDELTARGIRQKPAKPDAEAPAEPEYGPDVPDFRTTMRRLSEINEAAFEDALARTRPSGARKSQADTIDQVVRLFRQRGSVADIVQEIGANRLYTLGQAKTFNLKGEWVSEYLDDVASGRIESSKEAFAEAFVKDIIENRYASNVELQARIKKNVREAVAAENNPRLSVNEAGEASARETPVSLDNLQDAIKRRSIDADDDGNLKLPNGKPVTPENVAELVERARAGIREKEEILARLKELPDDAPVESVRKAIGYGDERATNQYDAILGLEEQVTKSRQYIDDLNLAARYQKPRPALEGLIPDRQFYMPRKLSRRKAIELEQRIATDGNSRGAEEQITDLIAQSLKRGREMYGLPVDEHVNNLVAKAYAKRLLHSKNPNKFTQDIEYLEEGDLDYIADLMRDAGIDEGEVSNAVRIMERGLKKNNVEVDADAPARLKHRLAMDMETSMPVRFTDGTEGTVSVRELFETNADDLHFDYVRWAGGEVGLNRVGLDSHKLDNLIKEAEVEAGKPLGDRRLYTTEQVEDLQWMRDRVMGRSLNTEFNPKTVRAARAATGIGFITRMGSAWWNAMVESGTILASNNLARIFRRIPALNDIMRNLRGKDPDMTLMRQLAMWNGGLGDTMMRGVYGSRHEASAAVFRFGDLHGPVSKGLAKAEDAIEGLKRGAAYTNLLGHVTDVTRQFSTVMALDTLDDILVRGRKAPSWWGNRAASWSLDEAKMAKLKDYMSSDMVKRGRMGEITDFGQPPMEITDILSDYLYRYTGEMIQHVDQGSLPRWMVKHPMMRVLTQFRSFTTAAWTKHTLKDIHMMDSLGALKFVNTAGLASLAYMARQVSDYYGTDEYEKRMTPSRILAGAVNYSVNASLLPAAIDQIAPAFGIQAPFAMARTSGLSNALFSTDLNGIPIGKYGLDAGKVAGYFGSNIVGAATGEGWQGPTKAQLRAAANVSMIQTLWFLKPLQTRAIEHFGSDNSTETINLWEEIGLE